MGILGSRIMSAREAKDWTQGQLAAYAHVNRSYLSLIERGLRTNVGSDHLTKIAHALKTTIDYLVGLTDDPRPLPIAQSSPIPPDVAEVAYRIQHLSHPVREKLLESFASLLDTCDIVEKEMRKDKRTVTEMRTGDR